MTEIISSGLTLTVPVQGETNWATVMRNVFIAVSGHDHTGGGNGVQINTNAIVADAVNDTKIRLRNNQPLRARNAANTADLNILVADASNNTVLQAESANTLFLKVATGTVNIQTGGTNRWQWDNSGQLVPMANNTHDVGNTSFRVRDVYSNRYTSNGWDVQIGTQSGHALILLTTNTERWRVTSGGIFQPGADNTYDIGLAATRVRDIYTARLTANGNDLTINTQTAHNLLFQTSNTTRLAVVANNIGINTTTEFGSGTGVIGLQNAPASPSTNPATGGVLYAEAGSLRWRGSGGTVTVIAPA